MPVSSTYKNLREGYLSDIGYNQPKEEIVKENFLEEAICMGSTQLNKWPPTEEKCKTCPAGSVAWGNSYKNCDICSTDGRYKGMKCDRPNLICPVGTSCGNKPIGWLSTCYPGKYCPENLFNDITKLEGIKCPPGKYCPCPNGKQWIEDSKTFRCIGGGIETPLDCPKGSYCPEGSENPIKCPSLSYCPEGSGEPMMKCPPGSYCPKGVGVDPIICPKGSYCPEGSENPIKCPSSLTTKGTNAKSLADCSEIDFSGGLKLDLGGAFGGGGSSGGGLNNLNFGNLGGGGGGCNIM